MPMDELTYFKCSFRLYIRLLFYPSAHAPSNDRLLSVPADHLVKGALPPADRQLILLILF